MITRDYPKPGSAKWTLLERLNWWMFVHAQKTVREPIRTVSRLTFRYITRPLKDAVLKRPRLLL